MRQHTVILCSTRSDSVVLWQLEWLEIIEVEKTEAVNMKEQVSAIPRKSNLLHDLLLVNPRHPKHGPQEMLVERRRLIKEKEEELSAAEFEEGDDKAKIKWMQVG